VGRRRQEVGGLQVQASGRMVKVGGGEQVKGLDVKGDRKGDTDTGDIQANSNRRSMSR